MKTTVFYDIHKALGARITEFAGYYMPVEYSGINDEHINVREKLGIFDVSHMGEIWVKGNGARDFVQKHTTNDVNRLSPGNIQYSCLTNPQGGIVDDLLVYHYSDSKYLLVVNASNIQKDYDWLFNCKTDNSVILENASGNISQVAVQGPLAVKVLQCLTNVKLEEVRNFTFIVAPFAGSEEVIISATGYTGAGGFELYFYNNEGPMIWNRIMEAGSNFGIKPVGLAARDTLRLEMGFCLYGNDIDDNTTPLEAGLGWITKFVEGNDFIGREYLEKQKNTGVRKKLMGFEMIDKGIPRQHYEVFNHHDEKIGEVTSGTMSPILKTGIGMAYLPVDYAVEETIIFISVRNKKLKAKVIKPPFYKT